MEKRKKGIILAGGMGTRLLPATRIVNKHMVPILNRPMITYPLETLKALGVTDVLLISGGGHIGGFCEFLEDGSDFGVSLTYRVQKNAGGIAQALGLAKDFAGEDSFWVILGDNIFDNRYLQNIDTEKKEAFLFLREAEDANRFGVVSFNKTGRITRITEKPKNPDTNIVVTGLYKYPPSVFNVIKNLTPSDRGELEITDVNNYYIKKKKLGYSHFDGFWSDAGTRESLFSATTWIYKNNFDLTL